MPRFSPQFLDDLKSRLRLSDIVGRTVKLRKQGTEFAGLSPFTQEKTPSFFVNDQKAFYHCFSSGKHGDAISFLQETQNLSFQEAVERLAGIAGMEIPRDVAVDAGARARRASLEDACEAAAEFFQSRLKTPAGQDGNAYLTRRGVGPGARTAFRLGFAPNARSALKERLRADGFDETTLVAAGLLIAPEDGGETYDRFRGRVMFPILGQKGRVVAFGGRALDPKARAKYLNSPETPLFHKGGLLYNYDAARKAAAERGGWSQSGQGAGQGLVVCEGYMDVIALWQAGVRTAVAPLGTALTEDQLQLLWRVDDEPSLCFDGDAAGLRAAHRSIDRALPLLKPGASLKFVFLPDGKDPDDVVREDGPAAIAALIAKALPLNEVLWRREREARPLDTPERRAAFRANLRALVRTIADKDVRGAYAAEFVARLSAEFAPPAAPRPGSRFERRQDSRQDSRLGGGYPQRSGPDAGRQSGRGGFLPPRAVAASAALRARGAPSSWGREATLVLGAVRHPALVERCEDEFARLRLMDRGLDDLLRAILSAVMAEPGLDTAALESHLSRSQAAETLERVLSDSALNTQTFLAPDAELDEVEFGWRDALRHHLIVTTSRAELTESAAQSVDETGERVWKAAVLAREELRNAVSSDQKGPDVDSRDYLALLEKVRAELQKKRGPSGR